MSIAQIDQPTPQKPLRLWPGVAIVIPMWVSWSVVPLVVSGPYGMIGGLLGGLAIVAWWLFFSRAPWPERVGAIVVMGIGLLATSRIVHESIRTAMMGMMLVIYSIPLLSSALVVWAVASRRLPDGARRAAMVATILVACGGWTLIRTGGITGEGDSDLHWRWTKSPEERLLARADEEPLAPARDAAVALPSAPAAAEIPGQPSVAKAGDEPATPPTEPAANAEPAAPPTAKTGAGWPGFRGPERADIVRGVRIETDWSKSPPVAMWRRPIGPGWSSFAVRGDLLYTQEQRGDDEVVACYKVSTGKPVWRHRDAVRFWESNGGAGPRATPTLSGNRLYTFGATGILNALDAGNGAVVWSRNAASDAGVKVPGWGFASSPLVVDDVLIVAAAGRLSGYEIATGNPRWLGPDHGVSYSSPHRAIIDGVTQILLLSEAGATSVAPATGTVLWEHPWPGVPIVQPALTANGDLLITTAGATGGAGTRRIAVARGSGGWTVEERWTSRGLKPYFNDFVVHKGHAFGFDGNILACIDLEDGKRKWKGGRYGNGQLVLLPDQDLLLVLSEDGELALVGATADQFTEFARIPAIDGKTWNHPVLVGNVLLVRNGEEMAAFRLALAGQ